MSRGAHHASVVVVVVGSQPTTNSFEAHDTVSTLSSETHCIEMMSNCISDSFPAGKLTLRSVDSFLMSAQETIKCLPLDLYCFTCVRWNAPFFSLSFACWARDAECEACSRLTSATVSCVFDEHGCPWKDQIYNRFCRRVHVNKKIWERLQSQ